MDSKLTVQKQVLKALQKNQNLEPTVVFKGLRTLVQNMYIMAVLSSLDFYISHFSGME